MSKQQSNDELLINLSEKPAPRILAGTFPAHILRLEVEDLEPKEGKPSAKRFVPWFILDDCSELTGKDLDNTEFSAKNMTNEIIRLGRGFLFTPVDEIEEGEEWRNRTYGIHLVEKMNFPFEEVTLDDKVFHKIREIESSEVQGVPVYITIAPVKRSKGDNGDTQVFLNVVDYRPREDGGIRDVSEHLPSSDRKGVSF